MESQEPRMKEKLEHLNAIRDELKKDDFNFLCATVIAQEYISSCNFQGIKRNRQNILNKVNAELKSIGCDSVSYGFLRKLC
ncbi:hypothetical protein [Ureibacillus aquaedulcis]|uniref:Uncharacterized protein n=1 Tax=Ureibacillus aquaedulcis TaxID=3058421 RepID=A0ABT8GPM7_9BACL|nr:hypothetical protein [Ureibacillus sp. BA0131]MDN4493363.1 hypothetical protein [Ureibacillus sp. BA0131]